MPFGHASREASTHFTCGVFKCNGDRTRHGVWRDIVLNNVFTKSKPAIIAYIMAGDPDLKTTALMIRALREAGADAIELGVPYGDPIADGPTIAAAGARALAKGTGIEETLQLVRRVAKEAPPMVLFTYYNPVYQYGIDRFAEEAASAGVAGVIVPDVALEEGQDLREALQSKQLDMPLLIAPTTPPDRAAQIARQSTGFVYVVSRLGVTGAGATPTFEPLRAQIAALRTATDKPLAVGFGISRREHVEAVADAVDGVIVGSALIDAYAGSSADEAASRAAQFVRSLATGANRSLA